MARAEKRERELKGREAAIQEHVKKLQSGQIEQQKADFLVDVRRDPLKVLAEAGISWHSLAQMVMTGAQQVPEVSDQPAAQNSGAPLGAEDIKKIVAEAVAEAQGQVNAQNYEQQYQSMIETALAKDEYKLMASIPGAKDLVYAEAVKLAHEKGSVLPPESVIATLQERKRGELQQLMNLDVVKTALGMEVAKPNTPSDTSSTPAESQPAESTTPETLGAEAGTTSRPDKPKPERKLTEHEILKEALKAVRR
jgi:hypothetical protein